MGSHAVALVGTRVAGPASSGGLLLAGASVLPSVMAALLVFRRRIRRQYHSPVALATGFFVVLLTGFPCIQLMHLVCHEGGGWNAADQMIASWLHAFACMPISWPLSLGLLKAAQWLYHRRDVGRQVAWYF